MKKKKSIKDIISYWESSFRFFYRRQQVKNKASIRIGHESN